MAVGSPMPEPSWSPAGGPGEAAPAAPDLHGSAPGAPVERPLDLALVRAAIRDGLLMVFGPEGDPVPPQAFGAAAAERPDAEVPLGDGPRVRAERVAAVLDAQLSGRLGAGLGGDEPWIRAMLGLAPQPVMAATDDLLAEACTLDVVTFGKELMITSQSGATFLIADARARTADSICVWVGSEGPIAPGTLADRLLGGAGQDGTERNPAEVTMPGCKAWLEDDALLLDLPEIGPVYLAHIADAGATAPAASLFTASGEVATINDLLDALSGPVPQPAVPEQAESLPAAPEQAESLPPAPEAESRPAAPEAESLPAAIERVEDLPPSSVQRDADGPPARAVSLAIDLPAALAGAPDRVALVVVRGLPEGSSLSAGAASGDGSWLLAPQDLSGLSLTPPRNWASDLSVEISAIAIASPAGDLTATASTVIVPWSAAVGPEPCATGDPASSPAGEPAPSAAVGPGCCPAVAPPASASIGSASSPWVAPAPSAAVGPGCCPAVAPAPSASIGSASSPWVAPTRASIPLDLEAHFPSEGGAFDAFIVRDLPTGVSLSAGTYDPALGVWVLLPHQLTGLSILTPGGWSEDFSLSLTGVCLHAAAGPPRLLARVPVRMGH